jgi:hypothetical protein
MDINPSAWRLWSLGCSMMRDGPPQKNTNLEKRKREGRRGEKVTDMYMCEKR